MTIQGFKYRDQQGTVLVISLILLLVLTIIGVTAIQSTSLDERMAANARARNLAFQAAESALREAERKTRAELDIILTDQQPDPNDDESWQDTDLVNQQTYTGAIGDGTDAVVAKPSYVVEKISVLPPYQYRITAYSQGSTETSVVVLEKIIIKP